MASKTNSSSERKKIRALEFYSGIGGMHYAMKRALYDEVDVVGAFDINTTVNSIYRHNFPHTPLCSKNTYNAVEHVGSLQLTPLFSRNICGMTAKELDRFRADFFVMCPPCQPFTRQGKREDCQDHRTDSFFHLLSLLPQVTHKVKYLFVENVQGFEESETRKYLVQTLKACDMEFREFLVSPTQFGIPNSRLRYYLLAKLESESEFTFPPLFSGKPFTFYPPTHKQETKPPPAHEGVENMEPLSKFCPNHCLGGSEFDRYSVPERICAKYITAMDIVTVGDSRTCCFTKAYGHYVVGTGSILQQNGNVSLDSVYQCYLSLSSNRQSLEEECGSQVYTKTPKDSILTSSDDVKVSAYRLPSSDVLPLTQAGNEPLSKDPPVGEDISKLLSTLGLRYFTEYEIAALHAFPPSFSFPDSTTLRQRYKALGNSLNVHVVQTLMQRLFNEVSL